MTHKIIIKCDGCGKTYPFPPDKSTWTTINVELREAECPACGGTAFKIMEVPDR